jgi:hypothetical protein
MDRILAERQEGVYGVEDMQEDDLLRVERFTCY